MGDLVFNATQAFQLLALGPSLFVILLLALTSKEPKQSSVPMLYFLALSCGLAWPLLAALPPGQVSPWVMGALLFGESLLPALSFLLILQFVIGHIPSWRYWLILAVPMVGGIWFVYATVMFEEVCFHEDTCLPASDFKTLYHFFGSALIFLLLMVEFARTSARPAAEDPHWAHKYWLVMALIAMNLSELVLDLALLMDSVGAAQGEFLLTMIRVAFVYLVLTSVFRVFSSAFAVPNVERVIAQRPRELTEEDHQLIGKIKALLEEEKAYQELGFGRRALAERLETKEHRVSALVNAHYKQSVSELLNTYRLQEARTRLAGERTPITVIAFEVGFASLSTFNRVFKEDTGLSPTEYREKYREA